jgi:hypothetical protein
VVDRVDPAAAQPWYRVVELTADGFGDATPAFVAHAATPGPGSGPGTLPGERSRGGRGRGARGR